MKTFTLLSIICLIIAVAIPAHAMDAEMLSSENKAVTGKVVIKMDPSVNAKSVHLVDSSNGTKIWIDVFKNMSGPFKSFLANAAKNKTPVIITGTFEKWSDGNTVLNPRKKIDYKKEDTASSSGDKSTPSCSCRMCY